MRSIEEGALSGAFVLRHREILRERVGQDVVLAALGELAPDVRAAIQDATALGWVPVDAVEELFAAAARLTGCEVTSLHAEILAIATERTIRTVWRILFQLTTDAQLISQAPVFYRKAWNRGTLTAQLLGRGRATLSLTSWPEVPEFTVRGVQVAVKQVLVLAGRNDVSLEYERTRDGAVYSATWT